MGVMANEFLIISTGIHANELLVVFMGIIFSPVHNYFHEVIASKLGVGSNAVNID